MLFLKFLDDLKAERQDEAELDGRDYAPILAETYRWRSWAAPKTAEGRPDRNAARTGEDLIDFVNAKLFPYLKKFRDTAENPDTLEYKIGEIFSEVINKFRSGYTLRDTLEIVDELNFNSQKAKHELSDLYEARVKRMGNAGRNGGEYYTPAPIRAMIKVVDPQTGEMIYVGARGSGGFLVTENVMDIQEADRHAIVPTNTPFGGGERKEVQQDFPIKSRKTAYLFLQQFMRKLRAGGRGAVVFKNTFLSNTDGASVARRKELLKSCNLHTVLNCPGGTFQGAGIKTVVLFFEEGSKTRSVWYYQLDPGRSLGKVIPPNDADLAKFLELQAGSGDSAQSWSVDVADLDGDTWNLSVKNPNVPEEAALREPAEIIDAMLARDAETARILEYIRGML